MSPVWCLLPSVSSPCPYHFYLHLRLCIRICRLLQWHSCVWGTATSLWAWWRWPPPLVRVWRCWLTPLWLVMARDGYRFNYSWFGWWRRLQGTCISGAATPWWHFLCTLSCLVLLLCHKHHQTSSFSMAVSYWINALKESCRVQSLD